MLVRSIPACAGEPADREGEGGRFRVYPRVCGGTGRLGSHHRSYRGLSPRVRGNPCDLEAPAAYGRSIPACAGEPVPTMLETWSYRVYPRVCGGTNESRSRRTATTGLSPRVRGNPLFLLPAAVSIGSIPACAGEPLAASFPPAPTRVYPRVCGGTEPAWHQRSVVLGLSPRVRGNLRGPRPHRLKHGSIPACAGEPSRSSRLERLPRVYPRVCGGTVL